MTKFQPGQMVILLPHKEGDDVYLPMQRATFLEYHADGWGALVRVWPIDRTTDDRDGLVDVPMEQIHENTP